MLNVALEVKKKLTILSDINVDLQEYKISDNEWLLLEHVFRFLKNVQVLSKLGSDSYATVPTVIVFFSLLNRVEQTIFNLDSKPDRTSVDERLLLGYQAAHDKMVKHYRRANWVYCAVLILDPRHKAETFALQVSPPERLGATLKAKL